MQPNSSQIKQIQQNCNNKETDIDTNHFLTRTMLSTVANILYSHLEGNNCQVNKQFKQNSKVTSEIIKMQQKQQINVIGQINDVKNIIEKKDVLHQEIQQFLLKQQKNRLNLQTEMEKDIKEVKINKQNKNKNNNIKNELQNKLKKWNQKITLMEKQIIQSSEQNQMQNNQQKQIDQQLIMKQIQRIRQRSMIKTRIEVDAEKWVDPQAYFYKKITIIGNQIINNNDFTFVFGKNVIIDYFKFSLTINKMKKCIAIGVIDQSFRNIKSIYRQRYNIYNCFLYFNDKDCYNGHQNILNVGQGFEVGDTVTVLVDLVNGTIEYKVNDKVIYKMNNKLLTKQNIKFVPLIFLYSKNAKVSIMQLP